MTAVQTIIFPTDDLARAKSMFTALLGVPPIADEPYYVGFRIGDQDIGLDPNGHRDSMPGPVAYCTVPDIRERLAALTTAGAEVLQDVRDVGQGKLTATVKLGGCVVGLMQSP